MSPYLIVVCQRGQIIGWNVENTQRIRDDFLEHGRRDHTAVITVLRGFIDHHGHYQTRIAGRCDTCENRDIIILPITAGDTLPRGTGLAGNQVSLGRRLLRRTLGPHDLGQHCQQLIGGSGFHDVS